MKYFILTLALFSTVNAFATFLDAEHSQCYGRAYLIWGDDPQAKYRCDIAAQKRQADKLKEEQQQERNSVRPHLCVAGCTDRNGQAILQNTLTVGIGTTLDAAQETAIYGASSQHKCNFIAKVDRCERLKSTNANTYVEVACLYKNGKSVDYTITSGKGRNFLEAEIIAKENLRKRYTCNYGVKIVKTL